MTSRHEPDGPYRDDPPAVPTRTRRPLNRWLAEIRDRADDGEWYRLPGDWPISTASNIRRGRLAGVADGEFAVRYQRVSDKARRAWIWVSWNGSDGAA